MEQGVLREISDLSRDTLLNEAWSVWSRLGLNLSVMIKVIGVKMSNGENKVANIESK